MSRLTFQIQDEARLRAGERFSLASLRNKLFGVSEPKPAFSIQSLPASRKYGQSRPTARPSYFDATPNDRPFVATSVCAKPVFVPIIPASTQTVYKDHVIHAVQMEDERWAAFHHPLNADPSTVRDHPVPTAQRFLARVLAIASAEIEIDDLENA